MIKVEQNFETCTACSIDLTNEKIYFDDDGNLYCEDCWIQYESKLKGLI